MTPREKVPVTILVAEDDEDYFRLTEEALQQSHLNNQIVWVKDGEECLDYLFRRGKYDSPEKAPRPGIILLDLNMPAKNGFEVLKEVKADRVLSQIPIVVMTVSRSEDDVVLSYKLGANSFVTKPLGFNQILDLVKTVNHYWFEIVTLSPEESSK